VICKSFGAVSLWLLGYPDQALAQCEAAIAMSRRLSPSSRAVALHFSAMLHQCCRDAAQARVCAEASHSIAVEHRLSYWQAGAGVLGGWASAATGSLAAGLERTREGLRDWKSTDSVTYETYFLGLLAEVLRDCGQIDEALRRINDALALVEKTGERLYEAELHRLRGELSFADDPANAEECFRRAVRIARAQDAKSLELRGAISWYRRCRGGPNGDAARSCLAEVYGWFTEGFATADLQSAKQLLAF
jgi:predicted ATPase